jgi:uncharacterized protein YcbX
MRVASLHIYPVKGCHRVDTESADVEPWGLAGDRRWLIVDARSGVAIMQRDHPGLTAIRPIPVDGGLVLRTPGRDDLDVPAPAGGECAEVEVWRERVKAAWAGPVAARWLSAALGRAVSLVYLDDPTQRPVNPEYAGEADRVTFADAFPVLLANAASLDALNEWIDDPVPITRFRPNVVVQGVPAWAEDGWVGGRLRIGAVEFRVPKPCNRCVTTTIDQETGEKGREPLATLGRQRRSAGGLMFAVNLIPDGTAPIAVGDRVEVL